jgi:TolA-binding protein
LSLERIEITPFAVIAGDLLQQRRTGYLTIIKPPLRKIVHWSQGELVLATSSAPEDSLADFLVRRGIVPADRAAWMATADPTAAVEKFHESGMLELSWRQTLLREWLSAQFLPLFSLDEGTAAFTEHAALEPERRVFVQSTAALILEGVRSISNGLILRRSLGDLKREIVLARDTRFDIESIALTEPERRIAQTLTRPQSIESFLKNFTSDSVTAAKVVIGLMAIGTFTIADAQSAPQMRAASNDDMQRDLELLAAIGSSDQRSLRAVALSRQLGSIDHYQLLNVSRSATRAQIVAAGEDMKKRYDPATYPPIVRESVQVIVRRIDEATGVLRDPIRKQAYDKLLQRSSGADDLQKRVTQRAIAEQNIQKARELVAAEDYFGAIQLLRQAVQFEPDYQHAWYLLGQCQERNPKWRRDATESYQRVLSIDPNNVEAMISLGDVYRAEGLTARAVNCYEDVIKIAPANQDAISRIENLKKR